MGFFFWGDHVGFEGIIEEQSIVALQLYFLSGNILQIYIST